VATHVLPFAKGNAVGHEAKHVCVAGFKNAVLPEHDDIHVVPPPELYGVAVGHVVTHVFDAGSK